MPNKSDPVTAPRGASMNVLLTVGIVLLAVVVIGGVLLFGGEDDGGNDSPGEAGRTPADTLAPADGHSVIDGPDGGVTVVEFLDYQCPACAGYYANITRKLEQDYQGEITFVVRNFPLDNHPLAELAARAAEAAGQLGEFDKMYHVLYDNYQRWALSPDGDNLRADEQRAMRRFIGYAEQIGLDTAKFRDAMDSADVTETIAQDKADAQRAGVDRTPTIFIDGRQFAPDGDSFAEVERQLRAQIDERLGS